MNQDYVSVNHPNRSDSNTGHADSVKKKRPDRSDYGSALFIFMLSLYFFASINATAALVLFAVCGIFAYLAFSRTTGFMRPAICMLAALFLFGVQLASMAIAVVFVTALAAVFIGRGKNPYLRAAVVFLIFGISFGLNFLYFGDFLSALTPFLTFPTIVLLSIAQKKQLPRSYAVALSAAGGVCAIFCLFLYLVYSCNGIVNTEIIGNIIEDARNQLAAYFASIDYKDFLPVTESSKPFDGPRAKELAAYIFNIGPGTLISIIGIAAYFIQGVAIKLKAAFGQKNEITPQMLLFRMSAVSAVVYLLSILTNFVGSVMSGENGELVAFIAINLFIVLLPGLVASAFTIIISKLKSGKIKPGLPLIVAFVITAAVMLVNAAAVLLLISVYGAIAIITDEIKAAKKPR